MPKAISAIIVTIMLLMITISLIAVFYVFSAALTGTTTSAGGEQVSQLTNQLSSCMQIDGVNTNDNKIYIRNCGKGVIEGKALQIFLDDAKISYNLTSTINEDESGEVSFYLKSCNEIKKSSGFHTFKITGSAGGLGLLSKNIDTKYQTGIYNIDVDGTGIMQPFQVYCDMETDGGGYTIFYSATGADGEQALVSNTENYGNPLSLQHFNLNRQKKISLSSMSSETLFKRDSGTWIKVNRAPFDNDLNTPNTHKDWTGLTITANNGASASGYMGYSNYNNDAGGDFGVGLGANFDHHSTSYYHLNAGCVNLFLYSYSSVAGDYDAGYDVNTALGTWTVTDACNGAEGGALKFYAAMR